MHRLTATQRVIISSDVLAQEVAGETVLLDLTSEKYFGLDRVGTRVWQLLSEGKHLDAVITSMLEEYEISEDQLQVDVLILLEKLQEANLVRLESQ